MWATTSAHEAPTMPQPLLPAITGEPSPWDEVLMAFLAEGQSGEDGPAGGVGEGGESSAEGVGIHASVSINDYHCGYITCR